MAILPVPSARRPCKPKVVNRPVYDSQEELRNGRSLSQLVLMAVRSFPEKAATFGQIQAILSHDPPNVVVSNFILKRCIKALREKKCLTYSETKYRCTGKLVKSRRPKRRRSRKELKKRRLSYERLRKNLITQADKMSRQRKAVLDRVVLKAMRNLKRAAEMSHESIGFRFNTIKARILLLTGKCLRNIVILEALRRLREKGAIVLKKGKNYLRAESKKKKAGKKNKKSEKSKGVNKKKISGKKKAGKRRHKKSKKVKKSCKVKCEKVKQPECTETSSKCTAIMNSITKMREQVQQMTAEENARANSN